MTPERQDQLCKALRHGIDVDGSLTSDSYVKLYTEAQEEWFDEYSASDGMYDPTLYSSLFRYGKEHFDRYNSPPSDYLIGEELYKQYSSLFRYGNSKTTVNDILLRMRRLEIRAGDLPKILDDIKADYYKHQQLALQLHTVKIRDSKGVKAALQFEARESARLYGAVGLDRDKDKVAKTAEEVVADFRARLESGEEISPSVANYGFPDMDNRTKGIGAAELIAISGPSGSGKSFVTSTIGIFNAIHCGRKWIFASNEMRQVDTDNRLIAQLTGIPSKLLKADKETLGEANYEMVNIVLTEIEKLKDQVLFIPKGSFHNLSQLKSIIYDRWGVEHGAVGMTLDYLDKLEPSIGTSGAEWEKMRYVCSEIQNFAAEDNLAIITPTQNNSIGMTNGGNTRQGKPMGLEAMSWKQIYRDFDTVFMLTEDPLDPYVPPNDPYGIGIPGTLVMSCIKSRQGGRNWDTKLSVEFATASIKEQVKQTWNQPSTGRV